jgi:hypothetical protein
VRSVAGDFLCLTSAYLAQASVIQPRGEPFFGWSSCHTGPQYVSEGTASPGHQFPLPIQTAMKRCQPIARLRAHARILQANYWRWVAMFHVQARHGPEARSLAALRNLSLTTVTAPRRLHCLATLLGSPKAPTVACESLGPSNRQC